MAKQIETEQSSFDDCDVSMGTNNRMESLCLTGGGAVILTLPASGRYIFRGIRFEYPFGFEPTFSPFKLAVINPDSLVFHMHSSPVSDGLAFKYTIEVKDTQSGAVLFIDPKIVNRPTNTN